MTDSQSVVNRFAALGAVASLPEPEVVADGNLVLELHQAYAAVRRATMDLDDATASLSRVLRVALRAGIVDPELLSALSADLAGALVPRVQ